MDEFYSFDIETALHDDLKTGSYITRWSRVVVAKDAYTRWETAAEVAACMAVIRHGGMPITILPRY